MKLLFSIYGAYIEFGQRFETSQIETVLINMSGSTLRSTHLFALVWADKKSGKYRCLSLEFTLGLEVKKPAWIVWSKINLTREIEGNTEDQNLYASRHHAERLSLRHEACKQAKDVVKSVTK